MNKSKLNMVERQRKRHCNNDKGDDPEIEIEIEIEIEKKRGVGTQRAATLREKRTVEIC